MRSVLFPVVIVATLASSFGAFAADSTTSGTIKSYDAKAMTLTLADGSSYVLPKGFKDPGLKAGEKVSIDWQMVNTKHQADKVTVMQ